MTKRQELTEFERGLIIGGWLFDHTKREIEEKLAFKVNNT